MWFQASTTLSVAVTLTRQVLGQIGGTLTGSAGSMQRRSRGDPLIAPPTMPRWSVVAGATSPAGFQPPSRVDSSTSPTETRPRSAAAVITELMPIMAPLGAGYSIPSKAGLE